MSQTEEKLAGDRFLREADLIPDVIPIAHATLWRWVRCGKFPAPVKLSEGVTAWHAADIRAWMQARRRGDK